ncbi:MAG: SRPBCC family protein [Solirubrobacteraceae bacterium]
MPDTRTETESVTREVTVDAPLEDVWEAVSTEPGRERWLEPDEDRRLVIEEAMAPSHISWWWWHESDDEPARFVDIDVVAVPDGGTRVTVTETQPAILPLARLRASMDLIYA